LWCELTAPWHREGPEKDRADGEWW
jgi:hypothetical protein